MELQVIKNAITSRVSRQILIGHKHSPTIMFAGGVIGVAATTVLACRATLKLEDVLEHSQELQEKARTLEHHAYTEKDRKHDVAIIKARTIGQVVRLYAPAASIGVVSVAALTGAHVTLNRRNAAAMAAYSALDQGIKEYRARVRSEFGNEKEEELWHGTVSQEIEIHDTEKGKVTKKNVTLMPEGTSPYARFFDEGSPNWSRDPWKNQMFVRVQQNWANDILKSRGHLFLNQVYDMLGFDHSKEGAVVGWVLGNDGDNYVDFGVLDNGMFRASRFINGDERSVLLDFNVDGVIFDKI